MSETAAIPRKPVAARARAAARATPPGTRETFRPAIQGLRALAVSMVIAYHVYPSLAPGGFAGVDVFFVISGFLITGNLLREYQRTAAISLIGFWGRRARRLIPAAALVLAVTWVASLKVLPPTQLTSVAAEVRASALYFQNWQLAGSSSGYLQAGTSASPVQHFWSLSVEEQFYLLWPLLLLAAGMLMRAGSRAEAALAFSRARRRAEPGASRGLGKGSRPGGKAEPGLALARGGSAVEPAVSPGRVRSRLLGAGVVLGLLTVGSLAYSAYDTHASPAGAYFVTTTRIWELGAGGLLAMAPAGLLGRVRRARWLGWLGLVMAAGSAVLLRDASGFPGVLALLPVAGALLVITFDDDVTRGGPGRLLRSRPLVFTGGISYALYLWHWPLIVLFAAWTGRPADSLTAPVLVLAAVLLAWATKVFIEDPVRGAGALRGHPWRSASTALAAVVPLALAGGFLAVQPGPWNGTLGPGYPGAAVLAGDSRQVPGLPALPPPGVPQSSFSPLYWQQGCLVDALDATPRECVYGQLAHPRLTVALVGDSIAGNWFPALEAIAAAERWKLVVELHGDCMLTAATLWYVHTASPFTACQQWGAAVMRDLTGQIRPDVVITSGRPTHETIHHRKGGHRARADIGAGMAAYWRQLLAHGIGVIDIREGPEMKASMLDCVLRHRDVSACDVPLRKAFYADPPSAYAERDMAAAGLGAAVPQIDMTSLICPARGCAPVIGNVLVFWDEHHLTREYVQTLTPFLRARLLTASAVLRGR